MPDREKIISAFDKCCHVMPCDDCELGDHCKNQPSPRMHIPLDLCDAVIELLKEQEAKYPVCEKCGREIKHITLKRRR